MIPKNSYHGIVHKSMNLDLNIYPNKCMFCQIKNLAENKPQMKKRKYENKCNN